MAMLSGLSIDLLLFLSGRLFYIFDLDFIILLQYIKLHNIYTNFKEHKEKTREQTDYCLNVVFKVTWILSYFKSQLRFYQRDLLELEVDN